MAKKYNTRTDGQPFDQDEVDDVWKKAFGSEETGKDCCDAPIEKSAYGKTGRYGWEIDHIKPRSKGGTDHPDNLQPLHRKNNRAKGDNYPKWRCREGKPGRIIVVSEKDC